MSRPFSYNDEKYTVIGNVLFCHITVSYVETNGNIAEIPHAIYKRLIQRSAKAFIVRTSKSNLTDTYTFNVYTSEENGKYYLKTQAEIKSAYIVTAFMFLEDI